MEHIIRSCWIKLSRLILRLSDRLQAREDQVAELQRRVGPEAEVVVQAARMVMLNEGSGISDEQTNRGRITEVLR